MGCDSNIRASAVQMLVMGLWLQHISVSLSVPSAINFVSNNDSESDRDGGGGGVARPRIIREVSRNKRKYEDYSDNVVSVIMWRILIH